MLLLPLCDYRRDDPRPDRDPDGRGRTRSPRSLPDRVRVLQPDPRKRGKDVLRHGTDAGGEQVHQGRDR